MTPEQEVAEASRKFYIALNTMSQGDGSVVNDVWWNDPSVTSGQPFGSWLHGWEAVRQSWLMMAALGMNSRIEVTDVAIRVHGDVAYTIGVEHVSWELNGEKKKFSSACTNIYRRVDGRWLVIHHHVDQSAEMQAALVSP